jgi:hypothetical protein
MTSIPDIIEKLETDAAYAEGRTGATIRQIGRDCAEAAAAIASLREALEVSTARAEACEREAVQWKGEALAHKSSLHEAYQVLTGATGEPANWNGARPFRKFKDVDEQAFVEWLRAWVRMKFGKIITYRTAYGARMSFGAERSQLLRETLASTSVSGALSHTTREEGARG